MSAKQNLSFLRSPGLSSFAPLFALISLLAPAVCRAESLEEGARLLASRVASIQPKGRAVNISWRNSSPSLGEGSDSLREAFVDQLKSDGILVSEESPSDSLRVTLQETPAAILFVAELSTAAGPQVRMVELPRGARSAESRASMSLRLQKELLWRQWGRIAAAAALLNASQKPRALLILNQEALALYRFEGEQWQLQDTRPLPNGSRFSRDPSGQIVFLDDPSGQARISLPGRACDAQLGDRLAVSCHPATEPVSEGVLLSAACGRSVWWLMGDSTDRTVPDRLLLRNPSLEKTAPSVSELEMPGPVLSISPEAGLHAAYAVLFNLSTGNYEVYRITLACD